MHFHPSHGRPRVAALIGLAPGMVAPSTFESQVTASVALWLRRTNLLHTQLSAKVCPVSIVEPACVELMADTEEADWIARAQRGDAAAFGQLVRMHQRRVYACAARMLGDRSEAEDAVQETFLRAYRAIDRFDGRAELSTWLYRICVNVSLNAIRKRKRIDTSDIHDPRVPEAEAEPTQGNTNPAHAVENAQLYARLSRAMDELSPSLRSTVVLVLLEGVPQKDAAEALGCSEGTIAWRIHESRKKLREKLGDLLDEISAEGRRP